MREKDIMQKPKVFRKENFSIFTGREVFWKFYERGYLKENYIPKELEDKDWHPYELSLYKVWWRSTNPADPSDPGEDIMDYIEECPTAYINYLIEEIDKKLYHTKNLNLILDVAKKLNVNIDNE